MFSRPARGLQLVVQIVSLALLTIVLTLSPARAQAQVDLAERMSASIKPLVEGVSRIEQKLAEGSLSDEELTALRQDLERLNSEALQRVTRFQPEIVSLSQAFDRLPPKPGEGQPEEPSDVAEERKRLTDLKARTSLAIKDAELVSVQSVGLMSRVLEARRAQFLSSLLRQRRLTTDTFLQVFSEAPAQVSTFWSTLSGWVVAAVRFNFQAVMILLVVLTGVGALIFRLLRPLRRWMLQVEQTEEPTSLQRVTLAFFATVIPAAAFALMALMTHWTISYLGLYRLRVDQIVYEMLLVSTGVYFVWRLLRSVLAPYHRPRRLLSLTDKAAHRLTYLGLLMALIYGLDYFASRLIVIFSAPVDFTIVKSLIATLLIVVVLIAVVMTRLNEPDERQLRSGYRGWNPIVYWLVWLGIVVIFLLEMGGYISLGRFVAGQIIITGSILATGYVGFQASRAIAESGAVATTRLGASLRERGASDLRLDQYGLVASILINILILFVVTPFLLLQFGYRWDEIFGWASSAITGFSIGGFQFSPGRLLLAILVFVFLIGLTRIVRQWFDSKVLARTRLDFGLQNSIRAGVGYLGYFVAALIALSWAGLNLSNIALVAGALSVGIGFGLQNIVNNFVSGIIMLVERPIKVGDIIAVGTTEGFVRKINVRATELETFDRQSVIIPNSEVINTSVGNWMHKDHVRRIIIRVGVAYGSDVVKVRDILLGVLEGDTRVSAFPPPFVYFADFGASSLDFQLRFFIRDLMETPVVESEVRFAIDKAFRDAGIEIPFPQQDVHIRSGLEPGPEPKAKPKRQANRKKS